MFDIKQLISEIIELESLIKETEKLLEDHPNDELLQYALKSDRKKLNNLKQIYYELSNETDNI